MCPPRCIHYSNPVWFVLGCTWLNKLGAPSSSVRLPIPLIICPSCLLLSQPVCLYQNCNTDYRRGLTGLWVGASMYFPTGNTPLSTRTAFALSPAALHCDSPSCHHHLIEKIPALFSWAFSGYVYHCVYPAAFQQGSQDRSWQITMVPWIYVGIRGQCSLYWGSTLRILTEIWQNWLNSSQKTRTASSPACCAPCQISESSQLTEDFYY